MMGIELAGEQAQRVQEPQVARGPAGDMEAQNLLRQGYDRNGETNAERREKILHLEKEAFQLANYYFVFQGVIFTGFYNIPSHSKCEYRWIPFSLSFLAGFLNLCALLRIMLKYKTTLDDIDREMVRDRHAQPGRGRNEPIAVICDRNWRLAYAIGCMSVVIAFLVITLFGCWKITCATATT